MIPDDFEPLQFPTYFIFQLGGVGGQAVVGLSSVRKSGFVRCLVVVTSCRKVYVLENVSTLQAEVVYDVTATIAK